MKHITVILTLFVVFLAACGSNDTSKFIPDVSNIKTDVKIQRFDRDIFALDTNHLDVEIPKIAQKYPEMFPLFVNNIIHDQTNPKETPEMALSGFLRAPQVRHLYDTCQVLYGNLDWLEKDLSQMFRFYKYYFPQRPVPEVVTMVSEYSTDAFVAGDNLCGIGLDLYLGENHAGYNPDFFPQYIRRQFYKEYMPVRLAKALAQDIIVDARGKRLIDQMLQNGKTLYVTDCLLPYTPDSLKMGYTREQMEGCFFNEAEMWARILDQQLLYSTEEEKWRKMVSPSPNSPIIFNEAPGEVGNWIGLRIIQAYMKRYPNTKMDELLKMNDAQQFLEKAKYKPKRK